jgi:MoaE protein
MSIRSSSLLVMTAPEQLLFSLGLLATRSKVDALINTKSPFLKAYRRESCNISRVPSVQVNRYNLLGSVLYAELHFSKLAIKTMADIMVAALRIPSAAGTSPIRCAIHHRLGTVHVGDPSIVIAVSSPHRQQAFCACETILEEVKSKVQIWKREYYEGDREEEAEWKVNN